MKRVKVLSMSDCFDYVTDSFEDDSLAIISIQKSTDNGYGFRFTVNSRCKGVLTLLFDDIVLPVDGLTPFTEASAREIIDFIRLHRKDADTLLIHCFAGMSRSRAVGAFAVKMLGGDNSAYFKTGSPNEHVYDTLMRVWAEYESNLTEEDSELKLRRQQLLEERKKLQDEWLAEHEQRWNSIKNELDKLLYDDPGIVTQLRDGLTGPFEENERIIELCREARRLILELGHAEIPQYDYFIEMMWQLSIYLGSSPELGWLEDYLDEISDALLMFDE